MKQLERYEFIMLVVTVVVGGIISVLDLTGGLDNISWLSNRIPTITLLMVTLIAGSLLIGIFNTRQFLKSVLPIGTFKQLDGYEEKISHILKRIKQAKKGVYDITWAQPHKSTVFSSTADREKYFEAIEAVSDRVQYREIMMFCGSNSRAEKARRLLLSDTAGKYYELSVYPDLPEDSPPRWQFIVIDEEEVILTDSQIAVRQEEIVQHFCNYYKILWDKAETIGRSETPNNKEKLEKAISRSFSVEKSTII